MKAFAVMKFMGWGSIELTSPITGQTAPMPDFGPGDPIGYIPIFETREDAVKRNGGEDHVYEIKIGKKDQP